MDPEGSQTPRPPRSFTTPQNPKVPDSHYPADKIDFTRSIVQNGFRISSCKLPILKAGPIEEMSSKLGINPPEMIFGDNFVRVQHLESGWSINFNAFDALDRVDKTGKSILQVAYSDEWKKSRESTHDEIKHIVKPFDWSYTTDYKGSVLSSMPFETLQGEAVESAIPIALLMRPDPILFFDDVMLYEDELADNGISMLSVKVRVMPERMLLLCRFFLRLDDVLCRIRDTRIYIDFTTKEVIRDYVEKESKYNEVEDAVKTAYRERHDDTAASMRDANLIAVHTKQQKHIAQVLRLP